jgi:hypothetical protein
MTVSRWWLCIFCCHEFTVFNLTTKQMSWFRVINCRNLNV